MGNLFEFSFFFFFFLSQPACQLATIFFFRVCLSQILAGMVNKFHHEGLPKLCVEKDSEVMSVLRLSRKEYGH